MSTREVTIANILFQIATPYAEGQTITAAEAKALNQTRIENISNSVRKQVKELASEDGTFTEEALKKASEIVADFDAKYTFAIRTPGPRKTVDPLEKEIESIAKTFVTSKIKEAGKDVKTYDKERFAALVEQAAAAPEVIALAKKRLAERGKVVSGLSLEV